MIKSSHVIISCALLAVALGFAKQGWCQSSSMNGGIKITKPVADSDYAPYNPNNTSLIDIEAEALIEITGYPKSKCKFHLFIAAGFDDYAVVSANIPSPLNPHFQEVTLDDLGSWKHKYSIAGQKSLSWGRHTADANLEATNVLYEQGLREDHLGFAAGPGTGIPGPPLPPPTGAD